jgi:hypothetical protein
MMLFEISVFQLKKKILRRIHYDALKSTLFVYIKMQHIFHLQHSKIDFLLL